MCNFSQAIAHRWPNNHLVGDLAKIHLPDWRYSGMGCRICQALVWVQHQYPNIMKVIVGTKYDIHFLMKLWWNSHLSCQINSWSTIQFKQPNDKCLCKYFWQSNHGKYNTVAVLVSLIMSREFPRALDCPSKVKYDEWDARIEYQMRKEDGLWWYSVKLAQSSLTNWGQNKMTAILQMTFLNSFSPTKMYEFEWVKENRLDLIAW